MKHIKLLLIVFCIGISSAWAQDAETAFHQAAGQYVKGSLQEARNTVASALQKYPQDPKLNNLMEKLKKENPENKEEQNNNKEEQKEENTEEKEKDQNKEENSNNKEDENQEGENPEKDELAENKEETGNEGEENKEGEQGEKEEERSRAENLKEMNLTEEKAKMILEAMKNNEIQYIQQNRRKVKENANYGKPDW